jgi:hypothetical protein
MTVQSLYHCKGMQWPSLSGTKSEQCLSCRWLQGVPASFWSLHISCRGNTRDAPDKRNIPVLITQVPYTTPATKITTYRYKCLTKVGFMAKTQNRSVLDYKPYLTGTLMGIDVASPDASMRLSVNKASQRLNRLDSSNTCRCTINCLKSSTCLCAQQSVTMVGRQHLLPTFLRYILFLWNKILRKFWMISTKYSEFFVIMNSQKMTCFWKQQKTRKKGNTYHTIGRRKAFLDFCR